MADDDLRGRMWAYIRSRSRSTENGHNLRFVRCWENTDPEYRDRVVHLYRERPDGKFDHSVGSMLTTTATPASDDE